jgi:hypothetical protein
MPKATNDAVLVRFSAKKRGVGRIGAGIAALDIIDAELVEHPGNGDLVLDRKIDAGRLLAVTQGVSNR